MKIKKADKKSVEIYKKLDSKQMCKDLKKQYDAKSVTYKDGTYTIILKKII
jgi:hypothetical protein